MNKSIAAFVAFAGMIAPLSVSQALTLWNNDNHEVGTKGYLRAGAGDSDGHTQICFKAPGAGAKYRLGNECEVYGKAGIYYQYDSSRDKNAFFARYEYTPEFSGDYGDSINHTGHVNNYLELGNIANTPVKVWLGRRQYFRRDIHINDYFYMNLKGDGIGIRDIPLGFADFDYTYLVDESHPDGLGLPGKIKQFNHEFSLSDITVNKNGSLTLDLRMSEIDGKTVGTPATQIHSANGWTISAQHRQKNFLGGTNTLVLQYGEGASRSAWNTPFENTASLARLTTAAAAEALEDAATWRLLDYHLYESDQWSMMSAFIVEDKESRTFDGIDQTWFSLGARPTWFIDQNWRLTGELGWDYVDDHAANSDGHLVKGTLAVEWAPEKRFFSRPALRAYLTQASWSNSFVGQIGGSEFASDDNGWNAGVQMEIWW